MYILLCKLREAVSETCYAVFYGKSGPAEYQRLYGKRATQQWAAIRQIAGEIVAFDRALLPRKYDAIQMATRVVGFCESLDDNPLDWLEAAPELLGDALLIFTPLERDELLLAGYFARYHEHQSWEDAAVVAGFDVAHAARVAINRYADRNKLPKPPVPRQRRWKTKPH